MSDPQTKTATPPPTGKTLAKMAGGAQIQAIVPTTLGEVFALAEMVLATGLAPAALDTPQKVTVVFLKGMEVGLPPMAALECIGIINGRACLYGDGIPTLLWTHGFKIEEHYTYGTAGDLNTCAAHCKITRPDGTEYTFSYSAEDAKENGLWDERTKDSKGNPNKAPWFKFKKRMLKMRCRGWLARDCGSDALKGMPIYEEQADIELAKGDYREVKQATLAVPDDIDETPAAPVVSEAEANQDAPIIDPKYLIALVEALETAESPSTFEEIWEGHQALVEAGRIAPEDVRTAEDAYEKHVKKFG